MLHVRLSYVIKVLLTYLTILRSHFRIILLYYIRIICIHHYHHLPYY